MLLPIVSFADEAQDKDAKDLSQVGIEGLMNMEVTTASKKSQSLFDVAAAMSVITQEDIRRSGVRTIPDALRMVPGIEVQQLTSDRWKISARGFELEYADKLLVLIDGRSVYEPDFAGVYWDAQDMVLDNVDRIEVIRGPGGSLWGANAVNGVINIITKSAKDTLGASLKSGAGSLDRTVQEGRYGTKFGKDGFLRVSGKYRLGASTKNGFGLGNNDDWHTSLFDFRADWGNETSGKFMTQGGVYSGKLGRTALGVSLSPPFSTLTPETQSVGHSFLLGKWDLPATKNASTSVQVYYDHAVRNQLEARGTRDTYDIDISRRQTPNDRNSLVYGFGYRQNRSDDFGITITYDPVRTFTRNFSGYLQDEIKLNSKDKLAVGIKAEHNDFTGMELQPSVRLSHTISPSQMTWAAISRAVRTPNASDLNLIADTAAFPTDLGIPGVVRLVKGNIQSEELLAYEAGYRLRKDDKFALDASAFYNVYRNLRASVAGVPFLENLPTPHLVMPIQYTNGLSAQTAGIEIDTKYQAGPAWKLGLFYRYQAPRYRFEPGAMSDNQNDVDSISHHVIGFSSAYQPTKSLLANLQLFYYDHLPDSGATDPRKIASNWRLDANFIWTAKPGLEFTLNFQNMLMPRRVETNLDGFTIPSAIPRSVYAGVSYKF